MAIYPVLAELQAFCGTSGDATVLQQILDGVQSWTEEYTRRVWVAPAAADKSFPVKKPYVTGLRLLFFRELSTIVTVTNGDGVVVAATDYRTNPVNDTPFYGLDLYSTSGVFWRSDGSGGMIVVNGKWGMGAAVPDDLFLAMLQLGKRKYLGHATGAPGAVTQAPGGKGVIVNAADVPPELMQIFEGHRKR